MLEFFLFILFYFTFFRHTIGHIDMSTATDIHVCVYIYIYIYIYIYTHTHTHIQ